MKIAPDVKGYPARIKELLAYTRGCLGEQWNFGVELTYRLVAPLERQTTENMIKVWLLRAAMDLSFTMTAVLDDITDNSDTRNNKKSWQKICSGGYGAAIYDGSLIGYLPFYILKNHFRSDPGYTLMMEILTEANTSTLIGQTLDVVGHGKEPCWNEYQDIVNCKAGLLVRAIPALGMLHAGILDENLLHQVSSVFERFGTLIQIWDDFSDYFNIPEDNGKPSCDFENGGTTWVSATAVYHFNADQKKKFMELYGSKDPKNVEEVKKLYDEIDVPRKYVDFMRDSYETISQLIDSIPHPKLREVCYSYMDWLIGDVRPEEYSPFIELLFGNQNTI